MLYFLSQSSDIANICGSTPGISLWIIVNRSPKRQCRMVVEILEPDGLGLNLSSVPYQQHDTAYLLPLPRFPPLKDGDNTSIKGWLWGLSEVKCVKHLQQYLTHSKQDISACFLLLLNYHLTLCIISFKNYFDNCLQI